MDTIAGTMIETATSTPTQARRDHRQMWDDRVVVTVMCDDTPDLRAIAKSEHQMWYARGGEAVYGIWKDNGEDGPVLEARFRVPQDIAPLLWLAEESDAYLAITTRDDDGYPWAWTIVPLYRDGLARAVAAASEHAEAEGDLERCKWDPTYRAK